jgi:hypothetical protein
MSVISAGTTAGTAVKVTGNTDGTVVIKTNDTGTGGTTAVTFGTDQRSTFAAAIAAPGVTNSALTSGRVVYSTTGGALTDSASFTFNGTILAVPTLNLTNALGIAYGGTGATTQQAALNAVAGAVTSGQYLRGNGTNVVMSAIQAADVPTLNQNTTGTASNVTGVVAAVNGGTGQSSYVVGDLLYASTTTALSKLADVATGNALISGGVGVAPSWGKVGLTTHVSGTLGTANGGTGNTSGQAASVANALTVINNGTGVVSGSTYNGSGAVTISYNSVGAPSATGTNASGTWGISITGSAGSASTATSATTAGSVTNSVTFNSSGLGAVSGTTFNGGSAVTVSYNTIGAYAASNPNGYTSNTGTVTSVTVAAGSGLSGGGTVSTSGTITLTNAGVTSVTAGSGISVSASTGGVTISNTATNQLTTTSGSAPYYGARAWVNFDGTTGTIRGSVNVSSITVNGTGDYTCNFSTAMANVNYVVSGTFRTTTGGCNISPFMTNTGAGSAPATGSFRFITNATTGVQNPDYVLLAVHN